MKAILLLACTVGIATSALGQDVKPEIEFKVLLIIKKVSDTYDPVCLPIRSRMTDTEIANARRCFEVETPRMVKEATGGKVRFVPSVYISEKPFRLNDAMGSVWEEDLLAELFTLAKPGDYDSVGCYVLNYDTSNGYRFPPGGYGIGGYNGKVGMRVFSINCAPQIHPLDEVFFHEWLHGVEGFYGSKPGVQLPKGGIHGAPRPWL